MQDSIIPSCRRVAALLAAATVAFAVGGCSYSSRSTWSDGTRVDFGVRADSVVGLESRVVPLETPAGTETVRVRNVAGRVTLRQDDGDTVRIEATVHAKGTSASPTETLLESMTWIEVPDHAGGSVWTLDYPVDRHATLHYVTTGRGFSVTTRRVYDRTITVTTSKQRGVPTLFADLVIVSPRGTRLDVHNLAGPVGGDRLAGDLAVQATAGSVEIEAFRGSLHVETASGDLFVGESDGRLHADTGSGDVTIGSAAGDVRAGTGSGDLRIETLHAEASLDTGSGDIAVMHAAGDRLDADAGSGDIVIGAGSSGRLDLDTGSGDIRVGGLDFEEMRAETGSGNIVISSSLTRAGRMSLGTGSGNVLIVAGDDASFDFRARTGSGAVRVGFRDAELRYVGRDVVGAQRGDGRTRIDVGTGSGNCTIRPGGDAS